MYIYDEIYEESFYYSKVFDFYFKDSLVLGEDNAKIGVFDIETTGLNPRNCQVVMGALLTKVDNGIRVRQFFADDDGEEEELLILYKEALDEVDVLVSYNGNAFDFPFLEYRIKRNYLDMTFDRVLSLDMYVVFNKFSNYREIIPNLKQKTVEEYWGLRDSRDDEIDGRQSVELYYRYLAEKSEQLRDIMLLHNRDDVLQLSRLLWAFDTLDIHRISAKIGFPVKVKDYIILVTTIKIKSKRLDVSGRYSGMTGNYRIFRDDCTVDMSPKHEKNLIDPESDYGDFKVSFPLRYEEKKSYVLLEDLDTEQPFTSESKMGEIDLIVLKDDGEPDYKMINYFIKHMIKDILEKI